MLPDGLNANRPLSFVLAGQPIQRMPLVTLLSTPLQPRSNQALDNRTPVEEVLN